MLEISGDVSFISTTTAAFHEMQNGIAGNPIWWWFIPVFKWECHTQLLAAGRAYIGAQIIRRQSGMK